MDEFEQIAADLEKSIKTDETTELSAAEVQEFLKDPANVRKALALGAKELAKAKGAITTDLSQEKAPKSKTVTETEDDPAETPVKSGKGYKDTRPYVGKGDDGDGDDDKDGKPSFFGKKKKAVKKGDEQADADDDVDVTELVQELVAHNGEMAKAINWLVDQVDGLRKSQETLVEGSGIFGQVLSEVAENDPRRDTLLINMGKAINKAMGELADIKKSVASQHDLVKAVTELPGAPRAAGLALIKAEAEGGAAAAGGNKLSKSETQQLYGLATSKKITTGEYREALQAPEVAAAIFARFK